MSYLRSVHLHKDKTIFKVAELPVEQFAASLGLPGVPKIKFLSKEKAKEKKNSSSGGVALQGGIDKELGGGGEEYNESTDEVESGNEAEHQGVRTMHGTLSQSDQSGDPKVCTHEAR